MYGVYSVYLSFECQIKWHEQETLKLVVHANTLCLL